MIPTSRRKFFAFLGGALAAPVAAKIAMALPAAPLPPLVMRTTTLAGDVYGRGPMMTATEVMRRSNDMIQEMIQAMGKQDIFAYIDWEEVEKELKRLDPVKRIT